MNSTTITNAFQKAPNSYRKSAEFEGAIVYGDSIFKGISIENIQITSEDYGKSTAEFSGDLHLDSSPALEPLKKLLALNGNLTAQGSVDLAVSDKPEIDISAPLQNQQLQFMHFNLEAQSIRLFTDYPEQSGGLPEAKVSLICHGTTQGSNSISFDLVATMTELEDTWEFAFQAEEGKGIPLGNGLEALPQIVGVDVNITLPDSLNQLLNNLTLQRFTINLNPFPATLKVNHLVVEVDLSGHWELIPGVFAVENPALGLLIVRPQTSNYLIAPYVKGTFVLGSSNSVHLDVEAEFLGEASAVAVLREGDVIRVSDAISSFTSLPELPEINISQLIINVESSGYLFFEGTFETPWTIPLNSGQSIQLEETSIGLERADGYSGYFLSKLKITDIELNLSAEYQTDKGWLFSGSTTPGKTLDIGHLISYLIERFGVEQNQIPGFINEISLEVLHTSFGSKSQNFQFTCEAKIPIGEGGNQEAVDVTINIHLTDNTNAYEINFDGTIVVYLSDKDPNDKLEFDLHFEKDSQSKELVATYIHSGGRQLVLHNLVNQISPTIASLIPSSLEIDLHSVLFAFSATANQNYKFLLGVNIGASISFTDLPLVGKQIPNGLNMGIENFQAIVASQAFQKQEITTLNSLLPAGFTKLPTKPSQGNNQQVYLQQGLFLAATIKLGDNSIPLSMPFSHSFNGSSGGDLKHVASPQPNQQEYPTTVAQNGAWLTVQKSFGPIHFEKVGLIYKDGEIHLTPQFVVQVSDFSLALNGLSVSTPLTNFSPHFNLDGFALEYLSDSLTIGGAFLHSENTEYEEYLGMVTLGMKTKGDKSLSLSAIGSYAYFDRGPHKGDVALFLYLAVDYPLGGPPFFFVTGLAGGFGYNHELIVPPLDKINEFPLVAQAVNGAGKINPDNGAEIIAKELESLDKYIPVSIGSGFLALGVKFTSFEMLDSFALLTLALNEGKFELNLIGISTLTVPTDTSAVGIDPVAVVQLALQARFAPNEGILLIRAQLTNNSYILSKKCHLTGGFAVAFWFAGEHAGDFVVTLGGYNPNFEAPDYYPTVPRLGLHWQLDNNTSITGEEYFALCSHAVMAGGRLALKYKEGSIWANLEVGADFLICWKPYYYDIHAYIHVSAGIGCISGSLGVDLHIWGPNFAGKAKIHLWIFSATVRFGANDSSSTQPITWENFQHSFLPKADKVCSVAASKGLVKQVLRGSEEVWIINPKDLELTTDSLIPAKQAYTTDGDYNTGTNQDFGINPMGVTASELQTSHRVTITQNNQSATGKFNYESLTKPAATGAWGEPDFTSGGGLKLPEVNAKRFVENTFSGFRITPAQPPKAGETHEIGVQYLQYDTTGIENAYSWQTLEQFNAKTSYSDSQRRNEIRDTITNNYQRNEVLAALGIDASEVNVTSAVADSFVFAPEVN